MRLTLRKTGRRGGRDLADSPQHARADINRIVKRVQGQRPDFMQTNLELSEVLSLIPAGGALVSLALSSRGSAVFVVPHGAQGVTEDDVIQLDSSCYAAIRRVLGAGSDELESGWTRAYDNYRVSGGGNPVFRKPWFRIIDAAGQELWNQLFGPMHSKLKSLGLTDGAPVVLLSQGWLRLLPLHSAWRTVDGRQRFFLDDWTVAYAPSCYVLAFSRKRLTEPRRQGRDLLAVSDPAIEARQRRKQLSHLT